MHSRSTRNVILKTSKAIRPWQTHRTRSPHYPTGLYRRCLATQPTRTVIFSGIQPTGVPHLGNYLGALRQWVNLQNTSQDNDEICYSIVDLHALTAQPNADHLKNWRREMLAALLALGLDSRKSVLFFQSAVLQPCILSFPLSMSEAFAGPRTCRTDVDSELYRLNGFALPHDPVEGEHCRGSQSFSEQHDLTK